MIKLLSKYIKVILILYIPLSIIKLFTIRIDSMREEDPTIYFKFVPTLTNIIYTFEDQDMYKREIYEEKYDWYKNKQYWEICHGSGSALFNNVYFLLIILWWVCSVVLIIYAFCKVVKILKKFNKNQGQSP